MSETSGVWLSLKLTPMHCVISVVSEGSRDVPDHVILRCTHPLIPDQEKLRISKG